MWDQSRDDPVTAPIGWMAAWERLPSDGPSWMGGGGGMHMRVYAYTCLDRGGPVIAPPERTMTLSESSGHSKEDRSGGTIYQKSEVLPP